MSKKKNAKKENRKFRKPTKDDARRFYTSKEWIHYTGSMVPPRPGMSLFSAILEHNYFPPGTLKNHEFQMLTTAWLHNTVWITVSIPTKKKHLAEAVAKYCGLKILSTFPVAHKKAMMIASLSKKKFKGMEKEWEMFPLHTIPNMFTMENTDDHPSRKMSAMQWFDYEHGLVKKITGEIPWTAEDQDELNRFHQYLHGERDDI